MTNRFYLILPFIIFSFLLAYIGNVISNQVLTNKINTPYEAKLINKTYEAILATYNTGTRVRILKYTITPTNDENTAIIEGVYRYKGRHRFISKIKGEEVIYLEIDNTKKKSQ